MQAHVFAAVMDNQQVDSSSPSAQQQRDVLAAALTSAVWQVRHVVPPAVINLPLSVPVQRQSDGSPKAARMHVATVLVCTNQDWLLAQEARLKHVLLLQASDGESASVVCCKQASTSGLTFDQLCQSAAQLPCKSRAEVEAAFQSQLGQFQEPHGYGLLLLLFSLLLTHGIR